MRYVSQVPPILSLHCFVVPTDKIFEMVKKEKEGTIFLSELQICLNHVHMHIYYFQNFVYVFYMSKRLGTSRKLIAWIICILFCHKSPTNVFFWTNSFSIFLCGKNSQIESWDISNTKLRILLMNYIFINSKKP